MKENISNTAEVYIKKRAEHFLSNYTGDKQDLVQVLADFYEFLQRCEEERQRA